MKHIGNMKHIDMKNMEMSSFGYLGRWGDIWSEISNHAAGCQSATWFADPIFTQIGCEE